MGNRILKETICLNRKIDRLTDFQENLFYRLIVNVDDYGIFFADPAVVASVLYPRKRNLSTKTVADAVQRIADTGLIRLYEYDGEQYLKIVSWEKHQRMRNSMHRYPTPQDKPAEEDRAAEEDGTEMPAAEVAETAESSAAETVPASAGVPEEPGVRELPVVELPLNDSSTYGVTQSEIGEYEKLYPAVNVEQELRNMRGWCMANPQKRKTRNGIRRFIVGWLARVQDKGGSAVSVKQPPENPFIRMAMEGPVGDSPGTNLFAPPAGEGGCGG